MQEAVKATEIIIPFVFYDGTNIPGGACKVKKGDYAWLFLDRSRKVGAELGVGGGEKAKSRNEWARVGVDDLMLVRGEIIVPHHYELYYFIVNKTLGPSSKPLFDYASTIAPASASDSGASSPAADDYDPVSVPSKGKRVNNGQVTPADRNLEGVNDDPNFTKVVDRRWYERNKHIFPASVWEEFDTTKDYTKDVRKDAEGNAFFFG
jgi:protein FAM50